MSSAARRWLAAALCLVMALGLFIPAGAAPLMLGDDYTVAEVPGGGERLVLDEDGGAVGTMPTHDHSSAVVDLPLSEGEGFDQPASLLAVQAAHTHSFNDGNLTSSFYTFDKGGKTPSTSDKNTKPAVSVTTSEGKTLTINKALKMESSTTITFTAPENGQLTMYCAASGSVKLNGGDTEYSVTGGKIVIPTSKGSCVIARKSGECHIVYMEWQSAGCDVHTWGTTYTQVTAPTCTEPGAEANKCTVCGATNLETREIKPLGHNFQSYTQTKAPTCAAEGLETGKCSRCDATDTRAVAATGKHSYAGGKCTVCGVTEGKEPCATHTLGAAVETPATCTAPGESKRTCSVCGMTVSTVLPATGHAWGAWSEKTAATCKVEGVEVRKCSKCQEEETRKTGFGAHKFSGNTCTVCGATAGIEAGGWFESLYAEIDGVSDNQVTAVTYSGPMSGALVGEDLEFLVRDATLSSGKSGVRIDIPGLTPGTYNLEVTAGGKFVANNIQVLAHDRSGFAHYNYTEGVGGYRDDGIVKEGAVVLYVTEATKNTVTLSAPDGTTVTGIGHILNTAGAHSKDGGKNNNNQDILQKLADADIPLVVRIIGKVTDPDGTTVFDSVDYGGTVGDNGGMVRMKSAKNVTIEGIGADAEMNGWGIHFMAAGNDPAAGRGKSFEVRNITFKDVPEDCVGMEGQYESKVFSPVERCWVHNCNFYPADIAHPAQSDKKEGDGSCDFKRGQYMTMSYNYFEGCHKTNLVGSGDSEASGPQYHITWHHNHWVNCKARGPLSRRANIHIYNNIYEHQTDYAQNPRVNTYIFSEYNTFINCKQPRLVDSGAIKSYMDALGSNITDDPSVKTVTDKSQKVTSGNQYENFDTDADMSYIPTGDYLLDASTLEARAKIYAYGGPMKAAKDMVTPEEVHALVLDKERVPAAAVTLPYTQTIDSSYVTGNTVKDNIVFNGGTSSSAGYKFTKSTTGQNVVFTVKESVNVTFAGTGICLISAETGGAVLDGGGTVSGLPAGTYYFQPNNFQPGDATGAGFSFKDGTLSSLAIEAASKPAHTHSYATSGTVVKEATCSATGLMRYDCTGCDEYKVEVIPMTAHNYVGGTCIMCGLSDSVLDDPNVTYDPVQSVTLDQTSAVIEQGNSATLVATVLPSTAKGAVAWSTSDAGVATVSRGVVVGKGAGFATITATSVADNTKLATCEVQVVGVTTKTYTFAAKDYGTYANDAAIAAGTKFGTDNYFTTTGNNTWRTEAANKPQSLLTASQGASGMSFTVSAGATAQSVTISVCSTGTNNYSSVALVDAAGNRVADANGKTVQAVKTKSGTAITFKGLPAGTYTIVSPKVENAADVGLPNLDSANNVNGRGVRIINISVTESKRSDGTASVPVSAVTLDKTAVSLERGQSVKLTATVAPANASNKNVTWTTSKATVATVSGGTVYATGAGIATITASCGGKSATATITVNSSTSTIVAVTGVTLDKTAAELKVGDTQTLTATVAPANATDKAVTWSTSNGAVATVLNGVVSARSAGTATITATAGGHSATCTLTVTVEQKPEEHNFQWVQTKAPTCTEKGEERLTCTKCGAVSQVREIAALVHAWSAWKIVKAPTCTVDGESERVCATCQTKETDPLEAPGHSYGAWQVSKPATCQETGVRVHYCTVCSASEEEDIGLAEHVLGDWEVVQEPTCTEEGKRAKRCSVGGELDNEETLPALGHDFENGKCVRCEMSEDVAEHDCVWTAWTAVAGKGATCTASGQEERTCTVAGCGAKERRDVAALGHSFGAWTVTKAATCTEKGAQSRTCSRCTQTESRELAALGHNYNEEGKCIVCGASQSAVSVPVTKVTLNKSKLSLKVNGTEALKATIAPANATNKNVTWSSNRTSVATVDENGKVTAKSEGTATITVTTVDGGYTATCTVTVTKSGGNGGGGGGGGGSSSGGGGGGSSTTTPTPSGLPFVDVADTAWYHDSVAKVYAMGLMKGSDATHFSPEQNTSRAMVATVLYRLDGEKKSDVKELFTDVADGQWYSDAVAWAADKGVVKGYDANTFAPDENVTREQLAVMLYRYANPGAVSTEGLSAKFVDAASISDWATEAIAWAVDKGIMNGKGAGVLDPQGLASRAEICAMLVRFVNVSK